MNRNDTAQNGIQILGFVAMAPYDVAATFANTIHTEADATHFMLQLNALFSDNVFNVTHYAQEDNLTS